MFFVLIGQRKTSIVPLLCQLNCHSAPVSQNFHGLIQKNVVMQFLCHANATFKDNASGITFCKNYLRRENSLKNGSTPKVYFSSSITGISLAKNLTAVALHRYLLWPIRKLWQNTI
jgi:hypothetical protein